MLRCKYIENNVENFFSTPPKKELEKVKLLKNSKFENTICSINIFPLIS